MKLSELKRLITLYSNGRIHAEDPDVVIHITLPYITAAGLPTVKVKSATMGFDWDAGKFILTPDEDLTSSDRDFADQMKKMQERAGAAEQENRHLKSEIRRLNKKYGINLDKN
jgi:hypothetical protein